MVILLITQAVCSELQIQFPIPINVYSICCFSLSLSVFWWVDCVQDNVALIPEYFFDEYQSRVVVSVVVGVEQQSRVEQQRASASTSSQHQQYKKKLTAPAPAASSTSRVVVVGGDSRSSRSRVAVQQTIGVVQSRISNRVLVKVI